MSNQHPEVTPTKWPDETRTKPHIRNVAPEQTLVLKEEVEGLDTNFYLLEIYPERPEDYVERYKVTRLNSCNRNDLYVHWTSSGTDGTHNIVYYEDDPRQGWNVTVCEEQAGGRNKKRKTARKRNRKRNRINKSKIRHESIRRKKTLR
jgi:hypothetical protein